MNILRLRLLHYLIIILIFAASSVNAQDDQINLTVEELLWLDTHPVIRVVQDPGWPPIEYKDNNGNAAGMSLDYLKLIEKRLGITFSIRPVESWQEAYSGLRTLDFDMTTSVAESPERLDFLIFTKPYMTIPIAVLTNKDIAYVSSLKELEKKRIAVVKDYTVSELIARDYPGIDFVEVTNVREGLEMLDNKQVFGFVENMLVAGHYMTKLRLTHIKIAGETPYKNAQAMAVRKDWPILANILQKTLDSITEEERDEIYFNWVQVEHKPGVNYTLVWKVISLSVVFVLILTLWIYQLHKEIRQRTKAESDLAESEFQMRSHITNTPMGVIKWDLDFNITEWNPAAERIFGYTISEAKQIGALCMVPQSLYPEVKNALTRLSLGDIQAETYMHNTGTNITKSGRVITCEWYNTPIISSKGIITGTAALVQDITAQISAEEQVKTSLAEKEVLLRELYHRTKNNMQLISSFLNIESHIINSSEVNKLVDNVNSRIETMSLVHEKLCQSKDLSKLSIKEYIEDIVNLISSLHVINSQKITFIKEIDEIEMSIDQAIPLGLVINEIVTNTYKYAFPDKHTGTLSIQLHQKEEGIIILDISDDGAGISKDNKKTASTFGMMTIRNIVEKQLHGELKITTDNGVSYHMILNSLQFT